MTDSIALDPQSIASLHQALRRGADRAPILDTLRQARDRLADHLLHTSDEEFVQQWQGYFGGIVTQFTQGPLFSVDLNGEDTQRADALAAELATSPSPQKMLAASLYRYAFELPLPTEIAFVPALLLEPVIRYLCAAPQTFAAPGDVERYAEHLRRWCRYFLAGISADTPRPSSLYGAGEFGSLMKCIPLYSTQDSLRDLYTDRAALINRIQHLNQWPLDHDFPPRQSGRKIRLGVVHPDFAGWTESYANLPLFGHLDRERFEIVLFTQRRDDSPVARAARAAASRLVMLNDDVSAQINAIRRECLDLLIFGANVTAVASPLVELACFRLARIQLTHFVSPVTTGMPFMDYFISGRLSEPENNPQAGYTEKLLLLEGPGFCFEFGIDSFPAEKPKSRGSLGLPGEAVVFASGANLHKIIPELMDLWARILAQVPDSRLLLFPFGPAWTASYDDVRFLRIFHERLARHQVAPGRLVVIERLPNRGAVRDILRLADIYLDSLRHGGGFSLVDPLSLDIPTVVHRGTNLRSLHAVGMMRDLGIPELIASGEDHYVRLAVELARDPARQHALSARIHAAMRRPPSFLDPVAHGAEVGRLYERILRDGGFLDE